MNLKIVENKIIINDDDGFEHVIDFENNFYFLTMYKDNLKCQKSLCFEEFGGRLSLEKIIQLTKESIMREFDHSSVLTHSPKCNIITGQIGRNDHVI